MLLHFAITSPDNSYCLGGTTIDEIKHKQGGIDNRHSNVYGGYGLARGSSVVTGCK